MDKLAQVVARGTLQPLHPLARATASRSMSGPR
jgi:hypothetical protein